MSDEMPLACEAVLPEVDEFLEGALVAQGEPGVRALGLLQDARRALRGAGLVRPAEVAAACVRSAADTLLKLPGAPESVGLQAAAQDLLDAVDAFRLPAGDGASAGPPAPADPAWELLEGAAEVLRGELERPGGYHRGRARGVIERLTGVTLGAAQETALDVWGVVYGLASGILHGRAAGPGDAVTLYTELLGAARELLVPLPDRAARVLELAALTQPGAEEAAELARWADPRATDYFFRSGPAPVWWGVLAEHAPHLLMPDPAAGGRWPAAPFLDHVAGADPDAARAWLAAPAGRDPALTRAQQVAAAGRPALDALLGLALRHGDVVGAAAVRAALADTARLRAGGGPEAGTTLRLAARWARTVPRAGRTRDWIIAVEGLLAGAVDAEHAGHLSLRAVAERVAAAATAAKEQAAAGDPAGAEAAMVAAFAQEEKLREQITEEAAARLPDSEAAVLLRELVATAYPDGRGNPAHPDIAMIRAVLAGLLARDVALLPAASRPLVFRGDLDEVHAGDPAAYGGPRLARTVLDLAAADADAGAGLPARTRAFARLAAVDPRLHDRLVAAHLAARPPAQLPAPAGDLDGQPWWEQALALVPRLLAAEPAPEPARLVALVFGACPPEHAAQLQTQVRAALGTPPPAALIEEVLPSGADRVDGLAEPLASWLLVWDWSPVMPAGVLAGWEPVLDAVRRLKPAGPPDPRTAPDLQPVKASTALAVEDLEQIAAARGPAAAAAALAEAEDAGDDGYAMVLHQLVAAGPAAWTADVPAVLAALKLPQLGAYYLAAAAVHADRPGAFPGTALTGAVTAALDLRRALNRPTPGPGPGESAAGARGAAVFFADQALFDLLTTVWCTGTTLDEGLEKAALAHLQALADELTRPAAGTAEETEDGSAPVATDVPAATLDVPADGGAPAQAGDSVTALLGSHPQVRALGCLLEYAVHRARTTGEMPPTVLDTVAGALATHAHDDAVATAVGVHLPGLHRHAPAFAAARRTDLYRIVPGRPSPAASWLRWGPYDRPLLAALERADLLAALRAEVPGAAEHLAHALLDDPCVLGDPAALWHELADGHGGADAAGRLLEAVGTRTPRAVDVPLAPAAAGRVEAAEVLWRAALTAGLPAGALAGAGAFADAAVDDAVWLELMRASAEHSPALSHAELVAERAAAHPGSQDALLLAELLVTHAPGTWTDPAVRGHARALLDAAAALPAAERPAAWQGLRGALVNAGDVDAARHQ
ncbi:hypothetical protein [Streptomyces longwoodensis]|uniref:hypothetical protein n=1 Tax=Streptomyces longwoodensis TaxID=68231 RepID=UPI0036EF716E